MTFFESLLLLMVAAIALLQLSRRLGMPYPALLAAAGVCVALIPGAPTLRLDPGTALPLFIAPVLLDAAFDYPIGAAWKLWRPLVALALVAVLLTTAVVAGLGWALAGMPIAAAIAMGAIVAPPDAAAATAVIGTVTLPRSTEGVLKGESLFNDATALLLFSAALQVQANGGIDSGVALRLGIAAPGGVLLGVGMALLVRRLNPLVNGTLGGNVFQFVTAFGAWVLAEHLHLSAVLCVVALAMTLASSSDVTGSPRMRVHSYAVWSTVVFLLNVLAFLLMGMQAHTLLSKLGDKLWETLAFAMLVVLATVIVRFVVVLGFSFLSNGKHRRPDERRLPLIRQSVLVGWSGMRGLVTLASAFALPASFPQRDLIATVAFTVVLATLVVQGATLGPLIRLLKLDRSDTGEREIREGRAALCDVALRTLADAEGAEAESLRVDYQTGEASNADPPDHGPAQRRQQLGLAAVAAERATLESLRRQRRIGSDVYSLLQEEIDWRELTLLPDDQRRIEEA